MSHVKTNIDTFFVSNAREYTTDEVAEMTTEQFDALPLSDQISVYNNHRAEYDRLTGRTAPSAKDSRTEAEAFADTFEQRVDDILQKNFHPNGIWIILQKRLKCSKTTQKRRKNMDKMDNLYS